MVNQIQQTYCPKDFEVQLHTKGKNLRQMDIDVASYTEEFNKFCLRSKVQKVERIKIARYINGLRWNIKEEI